MILFATSYSSKLRAGDIVEVLSYQEIMETIDANGKLDNMPFMPEMIKYCGKQFRVNKRVNYACIDGNGMGGFNKTVTLENVRCDGTSHSDCKKSCSIFWKEDWLKKSSGYADSLNKQTPPIIDNDKLKAFNSETGEFICQSTCLSSASIQLTLLSKVPYLIKELFSGNREFVKSLKTLFYFLGYKISRKSNNSTCRSLRGTSLKTPTASLNLQVGDWVEVKSIGEIIETLDSEGKNRGLEFTAEMHNFCGKKYRVRNRLDKMISGEDCQMVELPNTVLLEDVNCQARCKGFGCSLNAYHYWREIWLRKYNAGVY